jgi:error-prone DNA polymerase
VKKVLERTLGVPIFQEQVMQLAIVARGFTPARRTSCARAMATWQKEGASANSRPSSRKACASAAMRGIRRAIYQQIHGFSD